MSSLLRKMTSSSTLTSPGRLYALADAAAHNVSLSTSLASVDHMVQMMLAIKQIDLAQLAFVQYPTQPEPNNSKKVVPDAALTAALMHRIKSAKPITLGAANLGVSAVLAKTRKSSVPAPSASTTKGSPTKTETPTSGTTSQRPDALSGLKGQIANEQTCSVAAS